MMSMSSRQRAVLIGGTVAFLAAAALYVIKSRRNDQQQQPQQQGSDTTNSPSQPAPPGDVRVTKGGIPIPGGAVPPEAAEVLTQLFQQAIERVASLPDSAVSQPDRLLLYALYKQATVGDRDIGRPSRFNVVAHAKYVAWGKFEGMPKETAMIKYVEASHYLAEDAASGVGGVSTSNQGPIPVQSQSDNADIMYTEEDEYRSSDEEDMLERATAMMTTMWKYVEWDCDRVHWLAYPSPAMIMVMRWKRTLLPYKLLQENEH